MITVYSLKSLERNYIYVGMTADLDRRMNEHNTGHERTTRPYAPFKLIFTEQFDNRILGRQKEKYLKSGIGKEFLHNLD